MTLAHATIELAKKRQTKNSQRFVRGPIYFDWINANIPDPASRLILVVRAFMDMKGESSIALTDQIWRAAAILDKDTRYRVLKRLRSVVHDLEIITRPGRTTLVQRKSTGQAIVPLSGRARV